MICYNEDNNVLISQWLEGEREWRIYLFFLLNINQFARIIVCGAISVYNNTELPKSISVQPFLVRNSALMQGFIVFNYAEKYPEAIAQLSQWLAEGKLKYTETIVNGFDTIPQTFLDLFDGKNSGKSKGEKSSEKSKKTF